jgi:Zn-dependent protease
MFNLKLLETLNNLAIIFPALIIIITLRGFGQAFSSKMFGDDTAQAHGFLSLNPLDHLDSVGLMLTLFILFVLSSLFVGSVPQYYWFILIILFATRSAYKVPLDEQNLKYYFLGILSFILFGSFLNFFAALLFVFISAYLPMGLLPKYMYTSFVVIFRTIIEFCVFFGVLDLIPLPPFSGGRILRIIVPLKWHGIIDWLERYSFIILMGMFLLPGFSRYFFGIIYYIAFSIKMFFLKIVF